MAEAILAIHYWFSLRETWVCRLLIVSSLRRGCYGSIPEKKAGCEHNHGKYKYGRKPLSQGTR